jgi:hypothetical protein
MFIPDPGSGLFHPESGSGGLYFGWCRYILYCTMRHIRLSEYLEYGYRTFIFFCYRTIGYRTPENYRLLSSGIFLNILPTVVMLYFPCPLKVEVKITEMMYEA